VSESSTQPRTPLSSDFHHQPMRLLPARMFQASPAASASAVKDRPAFGTSVSFGTSFGMGASSGSSTIRSTAPKVATPSFGGGFKTPAPKPPAESGSYQSAASLSTTKVPTKAASASFSKSAVFGTCHFLSSFSPLANLVLWSLRMYWLLYLQVLGSNARLHCCRQS
jgi:hypothetical protein